jgi:hypothetical protein
MNNINKVNIYLRMYLLMLSISIIFELINYPPIELLRYWVITMLIYSISMITILKNKKNIKPYLPLVVSGVVTFILILPINYLKIPNYVIYISTIVLFFIYYFRFFKLNNFQNIALVFIPYLVSIVIIILEVKITHQGTLQLIILSLLASVVLLDYISWEFKE